MALTGQEQNYVSAVQTQCQALLDLEHVLDLLCLQYDEDNFGSSITDQDFTEPSASGGTPFPHLTQSLIWNSRAAIGAIRDVIQQKRADLIKMKG